MKKMLAMLLALCMILSMAPAMAESADHGTIIYGSTTEIGGDFWFTSLWTNGATDAMLRSMTNELDTVVTDQGGALVVNPTVAANVESAMNDDGSKTYTITINEGLVYNNGEAITAKDFIWASVFNCSQVAADLGGKSTASTTFVG